MICKQSESIKPGPHLEAFLSQPKYCAYAPCPCPCLQPARKFAACMCNGATNHATGSEASTAKSQSEGQRRRSPNLGVWFTMAATWQAAVQFPRRTIKAMTTRQRLKAMALLQPRDNRRKIVTFVRLYQPQQGDDSEQNEQLHGSTAPDNQQPIVNLTRGQNNFCEKCQHLSLLFPFMQ